MPNLERIKLILIRTIYQLFIPANMMFSRYLDSASQIMASIGSQRNLANHMHNFATSIRSAITKYGIVNDPKYGQVYAFEVDGYGSGKRASFYLASLHAHQNSKSNGRCKHSLASQCSLLRLPKRNRSYLSKYSKIRSRER